MFCSIAPTSRVALTVLVCLATSLLASGCSTLTGRSKGPLDNLDYGGLERAGYTMGPTGAQIPVPTGTENPSIVLEVNKGKRHMERIPLPSDKPMFVADVVRDAKLVEKLGRINVSIVRPTGANMPPVRLDVDFDTKGKNVMEGQNYSLRAGDMVVVSPDSTSAMDRFLATVNPWSEGKNQR